MPCHHRLEPGTRFLPLAWIVAGLLLFVVRPTAGLGDALLFYPPMAWLAAAAWGRETGVAARWLGAALAMPSDAIALTVAVIFLLQNPWRPG